VNPELLLVTCGYFPGGEPGHEHLDAALAELGVDARWVAWDDATVDFSGSLVAVRATWDYDARREDFLAWARSVPRLLNGADVFTWNTDKAYLVELADAGVPVVDERLVTTLADAGAAAAVLGYPIALKVVSDEIPHRSELGLVAAGLRDERELTREWERMWHRLREIGQHTAARFLVQEHVDQGLEVFAGIQADPAFGPVLAFGAGGLLVEALADVAFRSLPLGAGEAQAMVEETRVSTLLAGFRGRPPGDIAALCRCLTALADFAWAEREWLAELDVNPIVVRERGCVVVDALIVPR
jgi:hypothetical protein